jgi:nicotinamide-nucleotide amidase
MKAEIVAIGSELVSGQSLDTNSQWISQKLEALGIPVRFHAVLGDDLAENVAAFRIAIGRVSLVVMSGGLGPTQDDLTREALAETAGVPLVEDPSSLEAIQAMFARRNRTMPERNRVQALMPRGAQALPNRVGTAPGVWMAVGGTIVACLPGVPHEMRIMFEEQVIPRLRSHGIVGRLIHQRKINLFGKGESEIEAEALDLTVRGRNPEVGITAHEATISFRISASGTTEDEAARAMEPTVATIRDRFAHMILGEGTDDMPEAVAAELARTNTTLATAESCTGGLIARMITTVPGISAHFFGGVVSYGNEAKVALLGVEPRLIEQHGAVSPEVAAAMATGVRDRLSAGIGLSVTGIAGPGGGTAEKPVGLVYLGLAMDRGVQTRRIEIGPEQPRDVIQGRAAKQALNWVRLTLLAKPTASPSG